MKWSQKSLERLELTFFCRFPVKQPINQLVVHSDTSTCIGPFNCLGQDKVDRQLRIMTLNEDGSVVC